MPESGSIERRWWTVADSDTLLAHLVLDLRLTGQVEVTATRSLAYILNKSEAALNALVELINSQTGRDLGDVDLVIAEDVYKTESGSGRIDFVGYDAEDKKRIVGEAKFDAAISSGQGGDYLHQLTTDGHAVLLFVVPDYRIDYLWGQVRKDVELTSQGVALGETSTRGRIKSAEVSYKDADWHLMMVSWRDLIDSLVKASSEDKGVLSDLHQLRGLAERMDEEAFQELKEEDLGQEIPRRLLALTRLIDTVVDAYGSQEGLLTLQGYRATATVDGYVRYFELLESGVKSWFGLSYHRWSAQGVSPLWFGLQAAGTNSQIDSSAYSDLLRSLRINFDGLDDGSIPITLLTDSDYQEVLADVIDQLRVVEEEIKRNLSIT